MIASSAVKQHPAPSNSHPRRVPAELSVSLQHDGPTSQKMSRAGGEDVQIQGKGKHIGLKLSTRHSSADSNNTEESVSMAVNKWFERSDEHPGDEIHYMLDDSEPSYFLPETGYSNEISPSNEKHPRQSHTRSEQPALGSFSTNGSSSDDYRSVIDDLTIENRKLRERLRKYECQYNHDLAKDRVVEIKLFRALPSQKRRDLEEMIRAFISTIDGLPDGPGSTHASAKPSSLPTTKHASKMKRLLSSLSSNPGLPDSAYSSLLGSRPSTSTANLEHTSSDKKLDENIEGAKKEKIESFLHDIPNRYLLHDLANIPLRKKKKLVVRRLEQLFTGKVNGIFGDHKQPLQQQEISKLAAREKIRGQWPETQNASIEGVREAHIKLENELDRDSEAPSFENLPGISFDDPTDRMSGPSLPGQRPTRPLDLDPDRKQVPSDNVEYIRHLGISTPQLGTNDSRDAGSDAQGWIYLNLLINMAQLHIINVTPDFVRSAVADLSEKLQLSPDGKKIRWRGGSDGTRLSSNSDASSGIRYQGSGIAQESYRKRRKIDTSNNYTSLPGISPTDNDPDSGFWSTHENSFHYKPLLFLSRAKSDDGLMSLDGYSSNGSSLRYDTQTGTLGQPYLDPFRSGSDSSRKMRRDDGPIVFYSDATFYTDLSGDRAGISTPLHVTDVNKDGYSNHVEEVVGCPSRKAAGELKHTSPGSIRGHRSFWDSSGGPEPWQDEPSRIKTPDLISDDASDMKFKVEWSTTSSTPISFLQDFSASGLDRIQPADHFTVAVETRRTKLESEMGMKLSKFSSPLHHASKFRHSIPEKLSNIFRALEQGCIATRLASLSTPPRASEPSIEQPVQIEILSTCFRQLTPSALPEPIAYFAQSSSSEEDVSDSSSENLYYDISHRHQGENISQLPLHTTNLAKFSSEGRRYVGDEGEVSDDDNVDDDDDDESIDMLAHARETDPQTVAKQEHEFEIDIQKMEASPTISEVTMGSVSDYLSGMSDSF